MHETVPLRCNCEGDDPVNFRVEADFRTQPEYLCRGCVAELLDEWVGDDGDLDQHWSFSIERLYTSAELASRASEMRVEA